MSHDRPTPAERAADVSHDPLRCHICLNPHLHGDQADPEFDELLSLRAEVARLKDVVKAEREACAGIAEHYSKMASSRCGFSPDNPGDEREIAAMGAQQSAFAIRDAIRARGR